MYLNVEMVKREPSFIDIESAELLYVYIKSYKVFKNTGFCLHPAFNIKAEVKNRLLNITIRKKKNFIDLFQKENLNLKIICGKNGAGKSSLLEILKRDNGDCCIYVFIDKNGIFAASEKVKIAYEDKIHLLSKSTIQSIDPLSVCPIHENMNVPDFELNKGFVPFYFEKQHIFDGILPKNEPIITHFDVKIFKSTFNEISPYTSSFLSNDDRDELRKIKDKDWLAFFLISCLCDNTCEQIIENIKKKNNNIIDFIKKLLERNKQKKLVSDIYKLQTELMVGNFEIKQYDDVMKKICDLSNKMDTLATKIYGEFFIVYHVKNLVHCLGYAQKNEKKRYLNDLSTGEYLKVSYNYELFHPLAQNSRMWLTNDEPENGLHPEWCRLFLLNYINSYKNIIRFCSKRVDNYQKKKRMSFFIATHSPFILSDITNDYVIYLKKDKNGYSREVSVRKNTFCGNIGEMFSTNFFMNATIGAFASSKIKKLVKDMEKGAYNEKMINLIGDSLLKKLLAAKMRRNAEN